ncbi:MAG: restriction endonuclease [Syntrophotaleaceae bacterium]
MENVISSYDEIKLTKSCNEIKNLLNNEEIEKIINNKKESCPNSTTIIDKVKIGGFVGKLCLFKNVLIFIRLIDDVRSIFVEIEFEDFDKLVIMHSSSANFNLYKNREHLININFPNYDGETVAKHFQHLIVKRENEIKKRENELARARVFEKLYREDLEVLLNGYITKIHKNMFLNLQEYREFIEKLNYITKVSKGFTSFYEDYHYFVKFLNLLTEKYKIDISLQDVKYVVEFLETKSIDIFAEECQELDLYYTHSLQEVSLNSLLLSHLQNISSEDPRSISLLACKSIKNGLIKNLSYVEAYELIDLKIGEINFHTDLESYENYLFDNQTFNSFDWRQVDSLSGEEFELLVESIMTKSGYVCETTKKTGDQGVDIIAKKNNIKIAIQAKRHSYPVSNSAIQEVLAGKEFYSCQKAIVVATNVFTKSAKELAAKTNVILWDRDYLMQKLQEVF